MTKGEVVPKYQRLTPEFVDANKDQVYKMSRIGCTDKEQSHILSISETNLRSNFLTELFEGRSHLRRALRRAQLESAIKDKNTTMLIWLGKNYLGQKEPKHSVEHSGGVTVEKVMFASTDKIVELKETGS